MPLSDNYFECMRRQVYTSPADLLRKRGLVTLKVWTEGRKKVVETGQVSTCRDFTPTFLGVQKK